MIDLANAAARRQGGGGTAATVPDTVEAVMVTCLKIVHYQLQKHGAPALAAQLQVSD